MQRTQIVIAIISIIVILVIIVVAVLMTRKKSGCTPNCNGKVCGNNGCGGMCGTCSNGTVCQNGQCVNSQIGYVCSQTGCVSGCQLSENANRELYSRDDIHRKLYPEYFQKPNNKFSQSSGRCYPTQGMCQNSCTTQPCSQTYPNGYCANQKLSCQNGMCIPPMASGCPYASSTVPIPQGLPDGKYRIQYKGTDMAGTNNLFVAITNPSAVWTLAEYSLTMSANSMFPACQVIAQDQCLGTKCGNAQGSKYPAPNPAGILYCIPNPASSIPQSFILGTDFIYSVDARAYLIPDLRSPVTTPCLYGSTWFYFNITYTTNESDAHVWTITSLS